MLIEKQIDPQVECPRCGGHWYHDLNEEGKPYTCFYCCNGTVKIYQSMVENDLKEQNGSS
jgi:peptide methionine sulfoxide reductase MsrB